MKSGSTQLRIFKTALILMTMGAVSLCLPLAHAKRKKKVVKYREHTQIDFSGQAVQGKIRTPEVFYIFQRKRATGYDAVHTPSTFSDHNSETLQIIDRSVAGDENKGGTP